MELIVYNPAQPYAKRRPAPQLHAIVLSTPLFLVPPLKGRHFLVLRPLESGCLLIVLPLQSR